MNRKNLIVICSDEHHFRFAGFRNHPNVKTPNLDALAADGAVFEQAYCSCPICTPSRMSFITGKYTHQIGSWAIGIPLDENEPTWARRLKEAGIPSTMIGKMDFCGPYQSGGFSDYKIIERRGAWPVYPRNAPFDARTVNYVRPGKQFLLKAAGIRRDFYTNGMDGHDCALGFYDHDRMITEWGLDYIRDKANSDSDEPWALYLGYLQPHWPFICPKKYFDMYYPDNIPEPFDCILPENPSLHPLMREFQKCCCFEGVTEDDVRRAVAAYCGMITCMDDQIGQVLNLLKEKGMYDDTYIIYTSDHGDSIGEHGLFFKECAYNGAVAVPLVMKGPGIEPGQRIDTPVTLVDMYPTILDLYGLEIEPDRPGKSWLPMLTGTGTYDMPYAFSEYHAHYFRSSWYMLVRDDYKYIYYANGVRPSLFNLKDDPQEMHDLAEDPAYADLLNEFKEQLYTILDPEEVDMQTKRDLCLIGPNGEDYTQTLTYDELLSGVASGRFPKIDEWPVYHEYFMEH